MIQVLHPSGSVLTVTLRARMLQTAVIQVSPQMPAPRVGAVSILRRAPKTGAVASRPSANRVQTAAGTVTAIQQWDHARATQASQAGIAATL